MKSTILVLAGLTSAISVAAQVDSPQEAANLMNGYLDRLNPAIHVNASMVKRVPVRGSYFWDVLNNDIHIQVASWNGTLIGYRDPMADDDLYRMKVAVPTAIKTEAEARDAARLVFQISGNESPEWHEARFYGFAFDPASNGVNEKRGRIAIKYEKSVKNFPGEYQTAIIDLNVVSGKVIRFVTDTLTQYSAPKSTLTHDEALARLRQKTDAEQDRAMEAGDKTYADRLKWPGNDYFQGRMELRVWTVTNPGLDDEDPVPPQPILGSTYWVDLLKTATARLCWYVWGPGWDVAVDAENGEPVFFALSKSGTSISDDVPRPPEGNGPVPGKPLVQGIKPGETNFTLSSNSHSGQDYSMPIFAILGTLFLGFCVWYWFKGK